MFRKFNFARHLLSLGLIAAMSAAAFADTVRLKDGSIIKGRIVGFSGGKFTVAIGIGSRARQLDFDVAEVESIQLDAPTAAVNTTERIASSKVEKDPQFIETSSPPAAVPRVVKTDTLRTEAKQPAVRIEPAPQQNRPSTNASLAKPVQVAVKVLADNSSNGWTNSGWVVKKGQKIRIMGDGTVSLGNGRTTGPSGSYDISDDKKLLKSVPTGALIAVIGDDNNEFIYVGADRTFTAARDGALFLGVNEGELDDNTGNFDVKVEIDPA